MNKVTVPFFIDPGLSVSVTVSTEIVSFSPV